MKSKVEAIEIAGATIGIFVAGVVILGLPRLSLAAQFFECAFPTPAEAEALAFLAIWAGAICMALMTLGSLVMDVGHAVAHQAASRRREMLEKAGEIGLGSLGLGLLVLALVHGQAQVHPGQIREALAMMRN